MSKSMASRLDDKSSWPSFDSLPLDPSGPAGNSWGLWGKDDGLGMLNLLTPDRTKNACQEVVHGIRVSLDFPLDKFKRPAFNRQPFHQEIRHKAPRTVNDDVLTFNTQSTSQWDGFRHFGNQQHKLYYNGRTQESVTTTHENGLQNWVQAGGIFGRAVLIDYASWAESHGKALNGTTTTSIRLEDLLACAHDQSVTFQPGDILLLRTGYPESVFSLSDGEMETFFSQPNPPAIGVESSEEMLRWLWENRFAAVVGDQPAFEAWPCQNPQYCLHEWLLAAWGMPIGELFNLADLAAECKKVGKWSFMLSSVPLHVPGGVASPPNAVAIL